MIYRRAGIPMVLVLALAGPWVAFGQEDPPVPGDAEAESRPTTTVQMIAENWKWIPDLIRVKKGTEVTLVVEGWDAPHTFVLKEFGVKVPIPEGKKTKVTFLADKAGEFKWKCGRPCGNGCPKMRGKLIVLE